MTVLYRSTRTIIAAPHAIFRALLDPHLLPRWRAPLGWEGELHDFDPRVEGGYRMAWRWAASVSGNGEADPEGGLVDAQFVEIAPDELIVERVVFPNGDGSRVPTRITTSLGAVRDGTKVTISVEDLPSPFPVEEFQPGLDAALKALADLLE